MFRVTFCACLAALLAGPAAAGADKGSAQAGQWAGTYRDAQVPLELKAKADGVYEGAILFNGQTFPLTARGEAGQLNGGFRTEDGSFDFTATRDGETVNLATGGKTCQLKRPSANPLASQTPALNPLAAAPGPPIRDAAGNKSSGAPTVYSVATATDLDEVIRGVRTGERTSADLGNVDQIVDRLNEQDPGRYVQIPLRDELLPLPEPQNR